MIEEYLLGFDVREPPGAFANLWPAERRELFLLRGDVRAPLSVDTLVWPSVFDTGQGIGLPRPERERLHLAGLPAPAFIGPNAGLWEDAAALRRYLTERRAEFQPSVMIAVSWLAGSGPEPAGSLAPHPLGPLPARHNPGWQRLGFDVADGSLLSGLANCGYEREEVQLLRAQWAPRLNASHLFDDLADAWQFRALTDARVPAHAPFSVYGLYRVGQQAR